MLYLDIQMTVLGLSLSFLFGLVCPHSFVAAAHAGFKPATYATKSLLHPLNVTPRFPENLAALNKHCFCT